MKQMTERLVVKIGRSYRFVRMEDIDWLEAEKNYLRLHLGGKSHLIRHTLGGIEEKLDPQRFVRINRSTIVNVERIKELRCLTNSNMQVVIDDNHSWNWGRRYRGNLARLIEGGLAG